MARCKARWCHDVHAACFSTKPLGMNPAGQFVLVRSGRNTYLAASAANGPGSHYIARGPRTLRSLAYAILRTVKAPKGRK
jgi:hypothetical protein